MIRALLYLQVCSTWNRLLAQARRLRQPRYLAGFLVGGLYFFFYFIRPLVMTTSSSRSRREAWWAGTAGGGAGAGGGWGPEFLAGLEWYGAAVLLIIVLAAWIFPQARAALTFTEAEATFLFSAPVERRTLIHFKLLRSQAGILFTTILMAFLSQRFGQRGAAWIHVAGWWLLLSTLNLHFLGASFARTRLLDLGVRPWQRRVVVLAVAAGLVGAAWYWMQTTVRPPGAADLEGVSSALAYGREFLGTQPLGTILWPFRWVLRPYLAETPWAFLVAAGPALLVLAAHYLWVIRSDVAFEEASMELAQRRAERMAVVRREPGQLAVGKARRAPWVLAPTGPAAVALLWKNLIGAGSMFTPRFWVVVVLCFGFPAMMLSVNGPRREVGALVAMLLLVALGWSLLLGPQILRQDFRQDLRSADLLKLYPLPGWKIALGELLAPAAILTAIQWTLLFLLVILFDRIPGGRSLPVWERGAMALGAALVCPAVNLVSLLIPNAAVLLFPAWVQAGPGGPQGLEATGQRLIFLLGQLLVFAVALLPAAAVAIGLHLAFSLWLGWVVAVPLAGFGAAVLLLAEGALGVMLLGRWFERLDLAAELRS